MNTWTFTATTSANGYTESGSIAAGTPERFVQRLVNGTDIAGSACSINQQTDAVVPLVVSITNTTPGFSNDLITSFIYNGGRVFSTTGAIPVAINFEFNFASSSQCYNSAQPVSIQCQNIEPGKSCQADGFAVLLDYFSPDNPNGNSAGLAGTAVTVTGGTENPDTGAFEASIRLDSFNGPGAIAGGALLSDGDQFEIDLSGQQLETGIYDVAGPSN